MLREYIAKELIKRHGCGVMTGKLRPVHVANGLYREILGATGKHKDLKQLFVFTAANTSEQDRERALLTILENSREKWGRLADDADQKDSVLAKRVLPMLRLMLAADGAAFGQSLEHSSLSTPTGGMVTSDPSDEHAGAFMHQLWSTDPQLSESFIPLIHSLIDPEKELLTADDLTVVFSPLWEGTKRRNPDTVPGNCEDILAFQSETAKDPVLSNLINAARNLAHFEQSFKPSAISTLERVVCLAALSVFCYVSTRCSSRLDRSRRPLLIQSHGSPESVCAKASRDSIEVMMRDCHDYVEQIIREFLAANNIDESSARGFDELEAVLTSNASGERSRAQVTDLLKYLREHTDSDNNTLSSEICAWVCKSDTLASYLRLLGVRVGLLYPQQRNPRKRVYPADRVIEVLVAGTVNLRDEMIEYHEFLDRLWNTFGLITGGRFEDEALLAESIGRSVRSHYLRQNSEAFLRRLEEQGFARRLADSKALVGLLNFRSS